MGAADGTLHASPRSLRRPPSPLPLLQAAQQGQAGGRQRHRRWVDAPAHMRSPSTPPLRPPGLTADRPRRRRALIRAPPAPAPERAAKPKPPAPAPRAAAPAGDAPKAPLSWAQRAAAAAQPAPAAPPAAPAPAPNAKPAAPQQPPPPQQPPAAAAAAPAPKPAPAAPQQQPAPPAASTGVTLPKGVAAVTERQPSIKFGNIDPSEIVPPVSGAGGGGAGAHSGQPVLGFVRAPGGCRGSRRRGWAWRGWAAVRRLGTGVEVACKGGGGAAAADSAAAGSVGARRPLPGAAPAGPSAAALA